METVGFPVAASSSRLLYKCLRGMTHNKGPIRSVSCAALVAPRAALTKCMFSGSERLVHACKQVQASKATRWAEMKDDTRRYNLKMSVQAARTLLSPSSSDPSTCASCSQVRQLSLVIAANKSTFHSSDTPFSWVNSSMFVVP